MAAAYAQMGESEKAEQHLAEGISKVGSLDVGSQVWDTNLDQLHYSIACAQLQLRLDEEVLVSLARSIDTGFANAPWLEADPMWDRIRNDSGFARLVERVRLIPPVTADLNRLPPPPVGASAAGIAPPT
jgi:hypothetical protein